jgi:DNA-binding NarL/FixJ family response regulator
MQRTGKPVSAPTSRRVRVLELLDEGLSVRATAKAVGTVPRELSRIGKRYVVRGLRLR